ncbi:polysaccharide deacetylase family protein [Hydrogenibacillus schlegelii]|uniref:NodB homology domain-containing protein n=1 Tax=Hydrogenibacillus schlegelii TaxID=1484 RepID=A0A132MGC1_HYDSH|nr:polysaccharide deacetylase family protein [Hydrogenibacillus schlegelii]KWW96890.1 hypothetical protein TR75_11895 [Hydrogenibacillus schlegelii]OAR05304.1 hypothetical protein SA87_08015 [Hydrogenibacillus schlegelii]
MRRPDRSGSGIGRPNIRPLRCRPPAPSTFRPLFRRAGLSALIALLLLLAAGCARSAVGPAAPSPYEASDRAPARENGPDDAGREVPVPPVAEVPADRSGMPDDPAGVPDPSPHEFVIHPVGGAGADAPGAILPASPPAPVAEPGPPSGGEAGEAYFVDPKSFTLKADGARSGASSEVQAPRAPAERVVLITVDDAPRGESTEALLGLFDRYHVRAIWFLNGIYAETHPALVREIVRRGHLLGNHTWSHKNLASLTPAEIEREVVGLNDWIEKTAGVRPAYFRPPYGIMPTKDRAKAEAIRKILAREGMQMMNWSLGSRDWEFSRPDDIVRTVVDHAFSGAVILFHDKKTTAEAMAPILERLSGAGYRFPAPSGPRP